MFGGRTRRTRAACLACVFATAALPAFGGTAEDLDRDIAKCPNLSACMRLLDANARVVRAHAPEFAARLQTFGARAKEELLSRVRRPRSSRESYDRQPPQLASDVLRHWKDWSEDDVPLIERATRDNPGLLAWPLARIGTPKAIALLVQNSANDDGGDAEPVLAVADNAWSYILAGLSGTEWQNYRTLLVRMAQIKDPPSDGWVSIAKDTAQPMQRRIGALRALSSLRRQFMNDSVRAALDSLLHDPDRQIRFEAVRAIREADGKATPEALAEACPSRSDPFTSAVDDDDWSYCLFDFAAHGEAAHLSGERILREFLYSSNGMDRAEGATALGYVAFEPAIPRLIALLQDPDWRVVYSAARSLGWMGAKEAVSTLNRVAASHWLAEVRDEARLAATGLESPAGKLAKPEHLLKFDETGNDSPAALFEVDARMVPDSAACKSDKWIWQGTPIDFSATGPERFIYPNYGNRGGGMRVPISSQGKLASGNLIGWDVGEWGGELTWEPRTGPSQRLYSTNVTAIAATNDGAVAVLSEGGLQAGGLIGYGGGVGFALHLVRDETGKWRLQEAAQFPRGVGDVTTVKPGVYAAASGGRVIVFSSERILGSASCLGDP